MAITNVPMVRMHNARKLPLAVATAALISSPLHAAKFDVGPFEATFLSRISLGASWRTEDPSNRVVSPGNTMGQGRSPTSTTDDGNLNYDKGDMYSLLLRGLHDLDLNAGNWGVFTRVKYWYDHALAGKSVNHGHAANNYRPNSHLETGDFEPLAQEAGFRFLDYYAYGEFDIGGRPLELRAGNMVLNWGENLFIQNGVSVISPFDVTALRRPGSEIREALLPVGMVYANFGVSYDLSVEAFYQYDWERSILDECGTYWNAGDPYGGGCDYLTVSATVPDSVQPGTPLQLDRAPDIKADDSGQYGISARYFSEALNATEFGLYYLNVHNSIPVFSIINPTFGFGQPAPLDPRIDPKFVFEFPEDIEVFGASFQTNIGDLAWSGEITYRPDFPLQINTTDLLQASALGIVAEWSPVLPRVLAAGPGALVSGYDNVEYTQVQTSIIKFFEQTWGADRISLLAEVGAVFLDGMESGVNYGRSATYGANTFEPFPSQLPAIPGLPPLAGAPISCNSHPLEAAGIIPNANPEYCDDDGFVTDFSWGYRVSVAATFNNIVAGTNLTPNMAWSHDVKGYSPPPNFTEGRQALSLGITADYLNIYQADLSYTTFFGADYNELEDRDFVSLSFSIAF